VLLDLSTVRGLNQGIEVFAGARLESAVGNILAADAIIRPRNRLEALGADLAVAAEARAVASRCDSLQGPPNTLHLTETGFDPAGSQVSLAAPLDLIEGIGDDFHGQLIAPFQGPFRFVSYVGSAFGVDVGTPWRIHFFCTISPLTYGKRETTILYLEAWRASRRLFGRG
jgi:hypothetical protein